MKTEVTAVLVDGRTADAVAVLRALRLAGPARIDALVAALGEGGLRLDLGADQGRQEERGLLDELARNGLLELRSRARSPALTLSPSSAHFGLAADPALLDAAHAPAFTTSRFTYVHRHESRTVLRNPLAACRLSVGEPAILELVFRPEPEPWPELAARPSLADQGAAILSLLLKAGVVLPCDAEGRTVEDEDPGRRQWEFHDAVFHASSRLGRTENPVGGSYRFRGSTEAEPAVKPNPWQDRRTVPLPVPDWAVVVQGDPTLTAAIEGRRSVRSHSLVPLSLEQLGEFLFRTVRNRSRYSDQHGDFVSRPYPNGGALYESEFYVTVNACQDLDRGFYYYDPQQHALFLVRDPCLQMDGLLADAYTSSAWTCWPQILITIASRFTRFNWKYSGMAYAAQLKNVGVIYQTMYLVATAMDLAACGLGSGNADRFAALSGLDYLREGSIGELMLGRPLHRDGGIGPRAATGQRPEAFRHAAP